MNQTDIAASVPGLTFPPHPLMPVSQIAVPSNEPQFPSETAGEGDLTLLISSLDGDQFFREATHGFAANVLHAGHATKTPLRIIQDWFRLVLSLVISALAGVTNLELDVGFGRYSHEGAKYGSWSKG